MKLIYKALLGAAGTWLAGKKISDHVADKQMHDIQRQTAQVQHARRIVQRNLGSFGGTADTYEKEDKLRESRKKLADTQQTYHQHILFRRNLKFDTTASDIKHSVEHTCDKVKDFFKPRR